MTVRPIHPTAEAMDKRFRAEPLDEIPEHEQRIKELEREMGIRPRVDLSVVT